MTKYLGTYIGTVQARDIGTPFIFVKRFSIPVCLGWGKVMPVDVGKELYIYSSGHIAIENTEQMLIRLSDSNSTPAGT